MFFLENNDCCAAYKNIRDLPSNKCRKDYVEKLYVSYAGKHDKNFLTDACWNFQQRFWEMYLWTFFTSNGVNLEPFQAKGPDFHFKKDEKRFWIEAIAANSGSGPDAPDEPDFSKIEARSFNDEPILLRVRNAIESKSEKFNQYLLEGIVKKEDSLFIAINLYSICSIILEDSLPLIAKAVYPFRHECITINSESLEVSGSFWTSRESIPKKSGSSVSTDIFLDPKYSQISGVISSQVSPGNILGSNRGDIVLIHNAGASSPAPENTIPCNLEFVIRPDGKNKQLQKIEKQVKWHI